MRRVVLWFAVSAVLIGAVASLVGLARRSASGTLTPEFSARRFDPYGLAALDAVLRERGTPVGWLQRPRLPDEFTGTLLQVTPNQSERIDVWALADGGKLSPNTWEKLTPPFSISAPFSITRVRPPPPAGRCQASSANTAWPSSACRAEQMRSCRSSR